MARLISSMLMSLDGYTEDVNGSSGRGAGKPLDARPRRPSRRAPVCREGVHARKSRGMPENPIDRVHRICLAVPEAHVKEAWGEPTLLAEFATDYGLL